jgi:predicted HAD superfamily hydrolase
MDVVYAFVYFYGKFKGFSGLLWLLMLGFVFFAQLIAQIIHKSNINLKVFVEIRYH